MKFSALDQRLSYFLDDIARTNGEADYQFPLPLRIDAWNSAQDTFGSHTLLEKTVVLSVPNGQAEMALPADFHEMGMMYDAKAKVAYQRLDIFSGYVEDINNEASYWVWGNVLRLGSKSGAELTLHYFADWPRIEFSVANGTVAYTRDDVLVPAWACGPLFHLTAAFCLDPQAIRASMDRNYDIKIASGTPIMNSRAQQAREHAWWYDYLIGKHRPQVRAVGAN